ncbi:MAG: hypothetical protein H6Q89_565 [Myxococcaceae bacterium]|nr:hypothetical protein [Myxococcaceae bacterium]
MKLYALLAFFCATAALAKTDCKEQCSAVRAPCASACQEGSKTKKATADCMKKMCEMAVAQCESQCGGGNAKKKH